jgi:hypothetical protein
MGFDPPDEEEPEGIGNLVAVFGRLPFGERPSFFSDRTGLTGP